MRSLGSAGLTEVRILGIEREPCWERRSLGRLLATGRSDMPDPSPFAFGVHNGWVYSGPIVRVAREPTVAWDFARSTCSDKWTVTFEVAEKVPMFERLIGWKVKQPT